MGLLKVDLARLTQFLFFRKGNYKGSRGDISSKNRKEFMSLYEAQVIPYGKLHTILVTHVSGKYLPAGRGTERSVGRLGKWM